MLINGATLTAVFVNLKTLFQKAFEGAPSDYLDTCMEVPSTGESVNYDWIDNFPKMRKWLGDKVVRKLKAHEYAIKNYPWEATIEVLRDKIDDDQVGIYAPQATDAGYSARTWPDELMSELKDGAFSQVCFDGQYFYDTDHPVAGSTASNKGTAALSNATTAAAAASYGAARLAIMTLTDDEGRKLGLIPNVLEVPPALETVANMLMNNDKLADESPNPYKGQCKVKVNPRLTSSTAWFLHVTNRPLKPFIFQIRKRPVFVSQINPDADDVFMRGVFKYGVEARGNAGYGLWQLSYGSTG
jgi:phage major head subunit gpT-like protein